MKDFVWTDALVRELIYAKLNMAEEYYGNVQKLLDEFKKSKKVAEENQPKYSFRQVREAIRAFNNYSDDESITNIIEKFIKDFFGNE